MTVRCGCARTIAALQDQFDLLQQHLHPCTTAERFVDLGETVFDCQTQLEWEKKTGVIVTDVICDDPGVCPDPNNVNNEYKWSLVPPWDFNGPAKTEFIDKLNTPPCYAGHCDWRLPEVVQDGGTEELETIFDETQGGCGSGLGACIDPIFGTTRASCHWSAITDANFPDRAWVFNFTAGTYFAGDKDAICHVRAVRTGSD